MHLNMDKHPKPEEQAENIPPEANTSKLKFQPTDVGQHFREENRPPVKTCVSSTPASGESRSRLSGVLSTLSPIFKYLNIENRQSPPQSVKCASSSSCLKSVGESAQHHSLNFSALYSGTLGATHQPYYLLDNECLPEITLLDDTNNTTMQLTTNDSAYHQSEPPAPKPNAIMCEKESNTGAPPCHPQPAETQKHKTIKLSEMKHSNVWNQLLEGNLPEMTFLDISSDLETTAGMQTSCEGVVQDKTQDVVQDRTQDVVQDRTQDVVQDRTQDVVQDRTQDVVQDETQDLAQNDTLDLAQNKTQDMVQDLAQDKTQDMVQDLAQDKTQDMVQDLAQDKTQDMVQDLAQDKTQNMVQDLAQDKTQNETHVMAQNKTQDMVQDLAQDKTRNETHVMAQNKTQDMVQDLAQDKTQNETHVMAQDKTQDMVQDLAQDKTRNETHVMAQNKTQDMVQDLAQDKTKDMVQDLAEDKTQDFAQDMVLDKTQDVIDQMAQPALDPGAETTPKVDTLDILKNKDLSTESVVTIKTSFEVTPDVSMSSTLKNRSLEPNFQNTVKPQVSVDSGPVSPPNNTFDCKPVSDQNGTITLSEISLKETLQNSLDQPGSHKICNVTNKLSNAASDVLHSEQPEHNRSSDSAETRPKVLENPEATFETLPGLELLSGGNGSQREDHSQPVLHETMELSDSSIISSVDTNNANALILDKTLDSVPDPRTSSTPMTNLRMFNLKTHTDEGQFLAAQKKLYQDGLSKLADHVPSEIPSNIVADRKTFLSQTGSKLLWPPSRATSQLLKTPNPYLGVKSTIPRKQESLQSNLPMKRQRLQDAVRKPAPPEGPSGITEKQSSSSLCTRTAVLKLPASGIQRPQISKMPSVGKPAALLKKLHTRSNSQALPSADKPCGSKALKTMTNNLEERKHRLTKGEALPLSKKQKMDAVKIPSSTEANSRSLKQPAVRQRLLLTKAQRHGCANCSVLEEQLKLKTQEMQRLQDELLKYTKKT